MPLHRRRRQRRRARAPGTPKAGRRAPAREVGEVGDHRRGGRRAAGAPAAERRGATGRPRRRRALNTPSTWRSGVPIRHHARVHALLQAVLGRRADAEQLDPVAQLAGERDVERRDVPDALDVDAGEVGRRSRTPARPGGRACGRRRCRRRRSSGRPRRSPGAGPRRAPPSKSRAGLAHRGQDVVAGAVEDAVDAADPVAGQALAQRLDDRDAAGHRGLEAERRAAAPRRARASSAP